jgi:DNA-binding beta-propeller fold protein YncE
MTRKVLILAPVVILLLLQAADLSAEKAEQTAPDPYAAYVWPPPPDKPHIRLTGILTGRIDVEGVSKFSKILIGASPQSIYDKLKKPFGVKFDQKGRVLVTDSALGAVIRFDQKQRKMDVIGTKGTTPLKTPLGLAVALDGTIYVADVGLHRVLAFEDGGALKSAYGHTGELSNPTGVAVSPDQKKLFVADSKEHRIAVFDIATGALIKTFGKKGGGDGELYFPTSLAFSRQGELCVVDQMNVRIVIFTQDGEFVDSFGQAGATFGKFVRPKDIALDDDGLIYVTDAAFSNVQIFRNDLRLLTFVGASGINPGQFQLASGVATRGNDFAVVDQLNRRVQLFRFIAPKK